MRRARLAAFALLTGLALASLIFSIVRWVPFGEYPGDAFFSLAAQTIPILLVALAVEAQARRFDLEETGKLIRIAAVIFLAAGETTALVVAAGLYEPVPGTLASDLLIVVTAVGLLGGFFAVIAVALFTPTGTSHQQGPGPLPTAREATAPKADRDLSPLLVLLLGATLGGVLWRFGSHRG